jgi:DNA-binding response OmpR family regulator
MEVVKQVIQQHVDRLKVLIADDDPPTRILLRAAISQWGYDVVEADDGEKAWEILGQSDAPRLLILDWLMPRLDGLALCERIKQGFVARPYIILLTQVAGTPNIIKGLEAGADEFLSKPFNMAELRSRLSVGARIVRFEKSLAQHNQELQSYVTHLKDVSSHMVDLSGRINELVNSDFVVDATQKNPDVLIKIRELKNNAETVLNLLQIFGAQQKGEDK